ncbi:hypothetical protein PM082_017487 [Marasmius tenuissimus]|nr:hypothetical protein PM082_017487 [Marasmius tenuissimus]
MSALGSVSVYDSIFRTIFTNEEIRAVFSDRAYVARCIEAEVALAKAEAVLKVIPEDAANKIAEGCLGSVDKLDWDQLQHDAEIVGYPILGLVRQLDKLCGESGKYIHWGATTQDIMDTASVLQIKSGLEIISRQLDSVREVLTRLSMKYRDTPMAGRTHLQHALPVTFGYKCAVWLSSLDRQEEHLRQLDRRVLLVQFGGAAGTLASLGSDDDTGLQVRAKMAEELGLHDPPISWHVARDGIAECVSFLSANPRRHPRENRPRPPPPQLFRVRRTSRTLRPTPRRIIYNASKTKQHLIRSHPRMFKAPTPTRGYSPRRNGLRSRTRFWSVASGVELRARGFLCREWGVEASRICVGWVGY